ncbi:MAG TPA: tetratricopeptide repeat protein, partial [Vicinamibacterales bacterium]|nr:tetratricopeptide repeat protein [Vicinamibacterales bacterium]
MTRRRLPFVVEALLAALVAAVPLARQEDARERAERAYRAANRGVAFLEQFDYGQAADAFRQALAIDSDLPAVHLNLAIALLYAGDPEAALPEARTAAAGLPDRPQ